MYQIISKTIYPHTVAATCVTERRLPGFLAIVEAKRRTKTKPLFYFENEYKLQ